MSVNNPQIVDYVWSGQEPFRQLKGKIQADVQNTCACATVIMVAVKGKVTNATQTMTFQDNIALTYVSGTTYRSALIDPIASEQMGMGVKPGDHLHVIVGATWTYGPKMEAGDADQGV